MQSSGATLAGLFLTFSQAQSSNFVLCVLCVGCGRLSVVGARNRYHISKWKPSRAHAHFAFVYSHQLLCNSKYSTFGRVKSARGGCDRARLVVRQNTFYMAVGCSFVCGWDSSSGRGFRRSPTYRRLKSRVLSGLGYVR